MRRRPESMRLRKERNVGERKSSRIGKKQKNGHTKMVGGKAMKLYSKKGKKNGS